jgi:hypothetical protein
MDNFEMESTSTPLNLIEPLPHALVASLTCAAAEEHYFEAYMKRVLPDTIEDEL